MGYDSVTNSIALTKISASSTLTATAGKVNHRSKQFQSQSQTQPSKKISNSQRERLIQAIMGNEFFQTDVFYPPDPTGTQDYTLIVLAANFEGKTHTVIWTDTSRNVPEGLISIANAVQEIASK